MAVDGHTNGRPSEMSATGLTMRVENRAAGPRGRASSRAVLERAITICGREVSPGRYRLMLSQRELATELGMSIGNFRRYLEQVSDLVISLKPLYVDLGDTINHQSDNHQVLAPQRSQLVQIPIPSPHDSPFTTTSLAAELLHCAAQLQQQAAGIIEKAALLLTNHAQNETEPRATPRAERASQDSQSGSFSQKNTDLLTDSLPIHARDAREYDAQNNPPARAPRSTANNQSEANQLSEEELADLLKPMMEFCQRTNSATVDPAGRQRIAKHSAEQIRGAVRHTLMLVRKQSDIRSPFGLLINMLDTNQVPMAASVKPASTPPPVDPSPAVEPELWQLAEQLAVNTTFWDSHIAPAHAGLAGRCPEQTKTRIIRIYGELANNPDLLSTARQVAA
jgi:hypothetical protein